MTNKEISKLLENVAAAYTIEDERKYHFQIVAYQKAADFIISFPQELSDIYKESKLKQLKGIGDTIKGYISELFSSGQVKHFDSILKNIPSSVFPILDVPSFGPKKAYKLVKTFKLNNDKTVIDDIEKLLRENKVSAVEGFGKKSEEEMLKSIEEFKKGRNKAKRMLFPFALEISNKIIEYLKLNKFVLEAYPLGSLRRCVSTIGDIDIAVATTNSKAVIEYFTKYPYTERILDKGTAKASIVISGGTQIDLMLMQPDSFGSLLQHFTGSKNHNVHLREYAVSKGLSLSEYGIKNLNSKGKEQTKYKTEESFYNAIGLDWIPPEMREDNGEIELAINHTLPKLVELSDIKGDLHIHSNFPIEPSHDMGQSSFKELLDKAKSLNYEYLGFSEHNPSVSKHTKGEMYEILLKRKNEIDGLKHEVKAISLLETDILASGELPLDDKCLSLLDGTIVSIHSNFNIGKEKMTERILNGLKHPKAKIFAHPTGRLLNSRMGYEFDREKIFEFCRKNNKALEINSWPERLDLPDVFVYEAIKQGVKFVIDTDSHIVNQMDNMPYGVSVARRGWATKMEILNTLLYKDFISWLKS